MKAILEFNQPGDLGDDIDIIIDLVEGEIDRCERARDQLGAGEWLAARVTLADGSAEADLDQWFIRLVVLWSSALPVGAPPKSADELIRRLEEFDREQLALSLTRAILVYQFAKRALPPSAEKLAYNLMQPLQKILGEGGAGVKAVLAGAPRKLGGVLGDFDAAVTSFTAKNYSTVAASKDTSLLIVRKLGELRRFLLAAERPLLEELRVLLGGTFRSFCEG